MLAFEGNECHPSIGVLDFGFLLFDFSFEALNLLRVMLCGVYLLLASAKPISFTDCQPLDSIFIAFLVCQAGGLVLAIVVAELFVPTLAIIQVRHHRYPDNLLVVFNIFVFKHLAEHLSQEIVHSLVRKLLGKTREHDSVS